MRKYHQILQLTKLQCILNTTTIAGNSFRANVRLIASHITKVLCECHIFVKRTRDNLKTLRCGSKQWWWLSRQLIDNLVSSGIPALKYDDQWAWDPACERICLSACSHRSVSWHLLKLTNTPLLAPNYLLMGSFAFVVMPCFVDWRI